MGPIIQKYKILKKIFSKGTLLEKEKFVNAFLEIMQKETQYPSPTYNEKTDHIQWGNNVFYMGNVYEDYLRSSSKKPDKFIINIFEKYKIIMKNKDGVAMPSFEEIVPILMPSIRSRLYFESIQKNLPYRLLNDFIGVCISMETEISIMLLNQFQLDEWGKDFDEVFNYALQNLEAINEGAFEELYPGVWRSMWKDGYDPSRILHADRFFDMDIKGDPVIFIPHREVLIVTGSEDNKGLEYAIDFCEEYQDSGYSISGMPFTPVAMGSGHYNLETFSVPTDHPLYEKISTLARRSIEREIFPLQEMRLEKIEKTYKKKRKKLNHIEPFLNFYKKSSNKISYWNARHKKSELIINKGEINGFSETQIISCPSIQEGEERLESELVAIKTQGYSQWDLKDAKYLFIKYAVLFVPNEKDIEKKYAIIDLMDEHLSKTGFGYCADGERGENCISILCVVFDSFNDIETIVQLLKNNNLIERITISEFGEEEKILWPQ